MRGCLIAPLKEGGGCFGGALAARGCSIEGRGRRLFLGKLPLRGAAGSSLFLGELPLRAGLHAQLREGEGSFCGSCRCAGLLDVRGREKAASGGAPAKQPRSS